VTATDTDPANPIIGSQATEVSACAPCGDLGLPTCQGNTPCYSGSPSGGTCQCGSKGEACCNGSQCAAGTACIEGVCQCGAVGQPCCSGVCGANLSCTTPTGGTPTCVCGTKGMACCNGSLCTAPGTVCLGGIRCEPCGQLNGNCCADSQCSAGLTCASGTCQCGFLHQPCCSGGCNSATEGNPTCDSASNTCVSSGAAPPPPCEPVASACGTSSGPFCCKGNILCNYGTCTACVPHGAACTQNSICCNAAGGDTCVGKVPSGQFVCDVPDGPPCGPGYPPPCPECLPGYPPPCPQENDHPGGAKPRLSPPRAKP
jgi:hypothetical protein